MASDGQKLVPWDVPGIAQELREIGAHISIRADEDFTLEAEKVTQDAQALLDNINVVREVLKKHPVGDVRHNIEVALVTAERQLNAIIARQDRFRELGEAHGRPVPDEKLPRPRWMTPGEAEKCDQALAEAATQIDAAGGVAGSEWLTPTEASMVFVDVRADVLTRLCNEGVIRCYGKGKASRRIDANSLARYLLSSREAGEHDNPAEIEARTKQIRRQKMR